MKRLAAAVLGGVAVVLEPMARQLVLRDLTVRIEVDPIKFDPIKIRIRVLDSARSKGRRWGRGYEAEESAEAG